MRYLFLFLLLGVATVMYGQGGSVSGSVNDETGKPMPSATAVLLNPADSTMKHFGITNGAGNFELKGVTRGEYLLQIGFIGYETVYRKISVPAPDNGRVGTISMMPKSVNAGEASVVGERVPLQFKSDTIEYNAKAFKVQSGAVVEELLKRLPGVEVDRSGNIKALGKDVNNVLVDGKEFFGRDPKVATRNLPADALDKVQVYDKRSDESEFTGIDDGTRDKTVNLILNEESRQGVFGDISGGAGTNDRYKGAFRINKFTENLQLSALGSFNNISQAGFSMGEFIATGGAMSSLSGGGTQVIMGGMSNFPVNFGQSSSGLTTSGSAGLNFSRSKTQYDRFFASYLGSGSKRDLEEASDTWNYITGNTFFTSGQSDQTQKDLGHRINFGVRDRIGLNQNLIINGNISLSDANSRMESESTNSINDLIVNSIERSTRDVSDRINGSTNGSYTIRMNESKTVLKIAADASLSYSIADSRFTNNTTFYSPFNEIVSNQFLKNTNNNLNLSGSVNLSQRIGALYYIEPEVRVGRSADDLTRRQGFPLPAEEVIDSLSPMFMKSYDWLRPGVTFRRNTKKSQLALALFAEIGKTGTVLNDDPEEASQLFRFVPRFNWDYEYKTGRRVMTSYQARVSTPSAGQLLPVVNNVNPLALSYGNRELKPELSHNVNLSWWLFDQFSFTSLMTGVSGTYTLDKISYARSIDEALVQRLTMVNVKDDYRLSGNLDFSTPIKPLGMKIGLSLSESYNRGISFVNSMENISSSLSHRVSLTLENRNKSKWDVRAGTRYQLTDAKYSLEGSPDNRYTNISWFSDLVYNPNDRWNFTVKADITNYSSESFENSEVVPLLTAEVTAYLFRNKRGMLTLNGYDLLNMNTGIERISEMNYLRERQTNTIGRFIMLSFKYRLNKFGDNTPSHSSITVIGR
jgi:hypothetical protein